MEFQELRERIDEIDSELTRLFEERMDVVSSIAAYKKEHNLPIFDPQRERQKLSRLAFCRPAGSGAVCPGPVRRHL